MWHNAKRKLTMTNETDKKQKLDNGIEDPHDPIPSLCVHVRGLAENTLERDVEGAVKQFGKVKNVMVMARKRQGLVEFDNLSSAKSCVEYSKSGNSIFVNGQPALFNFSTSNKIEPPKEENSNENNCVLLFTILNAQYVITVDVMYKITSPFGKVQRIVVFKKNQVQAMVEFDSKDSAQKAKDSLNGADIYSGCCSLKVSFAKAAYLNVQKNNAETWDYTKESPDAPTGKALLREPTYGGSPNAVDDRGGVFGGQGAVCLVYNLAKDKMNCDRLFNLFCLYGNVDRVKFLRSKEGTAMVQMNDVHSADRALQNLNGINAFGQRIKVAISKQTSLNEEPNPYPMEDGTKSYVNYSSNRNNRFTNQQAASKNRVQAPSKVLHFYNAPPKFSDDEMNKIFVKAIGQAPVKITHFPSKTEKSLTGLVEFENQTQAVEALIMANHDPIEIKDSKNPFLFKLCFTRDNSS